MATVTVLSRQTWGAAQKNTSSLAPMPPMVTGTAAAREEARNTRASPADASADRALARHKTAPACRPWIISPRVNARPAAGLKSFNKLICQSA